ncbi:MAG: hypothetical protein ACI915_001880 [Gammaproteobacteria bacterium]|jgi:hypothetical protein
MNKLTVKQTFVLALTVGTLCGGITPLPAAESATRSSQSQAPLEILDQNSLEAIVAPIALYPDELLGVVLPGSTFPLQVVQASRYLEEHKSDPTLEPNSRWDDTIVALLNYPEVIALLNENLDWTWALGEAVINQQSDVIEAVERFRQRASAAGNLQSDNHKVVSQNNGAIEIRSADPQSVYVPYYEPTQMVYPQSSVVYHYYPNSYPVYYYPYSTSSHYYASAFWGISTAFSIGWTTNRLHLNHRGYRSHPYYGHRFNRSVFRRLNTSSHGTNSRHRGNHHRYGDYWNPGNRQGRRLRHHRNDFDNRRVDINRRNGGDFRNGNAGSRRIDRSGRGADRRSAVPNQFRRQELNGFRRNATQTLGVVSGNALNRNRPARNNELARRAPGRSAAIAGANRGSFADATGRRGANIDNHTRAQRSRTQNAVHQRNTPAQAPRNQRGTLYRGAANTSIQRQAGTSALANPRPSPANNIENAQARNRANSNRPEEHRSNANRPTRVKPDRTVGAPGFSAAIRAANAGRPSRSASVGLRNGAQPRQKGLRNQNRRHAGGVSGSGRSRSGN